MTSLQPDEILVGNAEDLVNVFRHLDVNGDFIEDISIPLDLYDPGYTVTNAYARDFAQYAGKIYVQITDFSLYDAVAEYDTDLNFVRFVCQLFDASDPAQNPDSASASFLHKPAGIATDADGVLYAGSFYDRAWIWTYNNDGTFRSILDSGLVSGNIVNPYWAVRPSDGEIDLINQSPPHDLIVQRFDSSASAISTVTVYTSPTTGRSQGLQGSYDAAENFYLSGDDFSAGVGSNTQIHIVDPTWATITHLAVTPPGGLNSGTGVVRPTSDASKAWLLSSGGSGLSSHDDIYQVSLADGSVLLGPIQVTTPNANTAVFVYTGVPYYPPCGDAPFTAKCGDVFLCVNPVSPETCERIEAYRGGVRIGRVIVDAVATAFGGMTMAFDRAGAIYVPQPTGDIDGRVMKLTPTGKHYITNPTTWWTAGVNEHPISVSFDRRNTAYVLVVGGNALWGSGTYLRLYKLAADASVLQTFDLDIPAGHNPVGISAGSYVDPDGSRYIYAFQDTADMVVESWDLLNDVALAEFAAEDESTFYPTGVRFHPDGRVLFGSAAYVMDPPIFRAYSSDGSSFVDYPSAYGPLSSFGDIENDRDSDHVYIVDGERGFAEVALYRLTLSTGDVQEVLTIPGVRNFVPIAVLCGGSMPAAKRVGFTTVIG